MAAYILHCSVEWVNQVKLIRLWLMKFVIRSVEIVGPSLIVRRRRHHQKNRLVTDRDNMCILCLSDEVFIERIFNNSN